MQEALELHTNHADKVQRIKTKNDMLLQFKGIPGTGEYQQFLKKLKKNSKKKVSKVKRRRVKSKSRKRKSKGRSKGRKRGKNFMRWNKISLKRKAKIPPFSEKSDSTARVYRKPVSSSRYRGTIIEKFSNFFKKKESDSALNSCRERVPFKNENKAKVNYATTLEPIRVKDELIRTDYAKLAEVDNPKDYFEPLMDEVQKKMDAYKLLKDYKNPQKRRKKAKSDKQKIKEIANKLNLGKLDGSAAEVMAKATARIVRIYNSQFADMIINDLLIETIANLNQIESTLTKNEREANIKKTCDDLFLEISRFRQNQNEFLAPNFHQKDKLRRKELIDKNYEENLKKIQDINNGVIDRRFHINHEFDTDRIKHMLIRDKIMKKGKFHPSYFANKKIQLKISKYFVIKMEKCQILNLQYLQKIPYRSKEFVKLSELMVNNMISQAIDKVSLEFKMIMQEYVEDEVKKEVMGIESLVEPG